MTWRIVHIKESDYMQLQLDNLSIMKRGQKYTIPLSDISMIIVEGETVITTKLLAKFTKYNIALIICDDRYLPTGIMLNYGNYHHCAKRSLQQLEWDPEIKNRIWQNIVGQKIINQILFAQIKKVEQDRIDIMKDLYSQLLPGDDTNREGHVAKVYFNSLYGKGFTRDGEDMANIAMNYGYAIVRAAIARLTVGQGLMTMIGVFHCNEYNSFNLVDDLMEPFRPIMDYWIDTQIFTRFEYLCYDARLTMIDFLNQPMQYNGRKSTVDQVMLKYVTSFMKAITLKDEKLIHDVRLDDFVEAER